MKKEKKRSARESEWPLSLGRIAIVAFFLIFWELSSGRLFDAFYLSTPTQVFARIWDMFTTSDLEKSVWFHASITLWEAFLGLVFGGIAGIVMGLALGLNERLGRLLDALIVAFNAVPRIALAPLLILWLGIGVEFKATLAGMVVFFLTFMNSYQGVKSVSPPLKNVVRLNGGNEWHVLTKAVWPATIPWVITGVAVSIPYSVVGAVVGEFLSSSRGLGYLIVRSSAFFDTTGTLASIILLASVVIILNSLLNRLESYLMRWRPKGAANQGSML